MIELEVVVDAHAYLGEGPLWDVQENCLYWVDIERGALHCYASGEDRVIARFEVPLGAVCLRRNGGLLLAADMGFAELDAGSLHWIASASKGDRMNDGKCGPSGHFFAGTLTRQQSPGAAALYRLDARGHVEPVLEDVTLANGLDWSPDGSLMYFVDTPTHKIALFDFDLVAGTLSNRRVFVDLANVAGNPDGLTVDAQGRVWVAMCHAGAVRCYDSRGRLAEVIELPVRKVTSLAFGGPGLDELYITTGSWSLPEIERYEPHAGAVFRCRPGAVGRPPGRFDG